MLNSNISTRVVVHCYNGADDTYTCQVEDLNDDSAPFNLPAILLPFLIGEQITDPDDVVGSTYALG